ncbi:MAG: hypothetical protein HPY45_10210 [Anaerolineae bacterium]|nr:hypothetical protein [Anaerolineae bacterium]
MEMSDRSIRDGVLLISGYHYFLAVLALVGVAAVIIYGIVPQLGGEEVLGAVFVPVLLVLLGLVLAGFYVSVGLGLPKYRNSSRLVAIFLSVIGILSGFVAVLGLMVIRITSTLVPNWIAVIMVGMIAICVYALIAFMDVFVLVFLFNGRVREAFYKTDLDTDVDVLLDDVEMLSPESEKTLPAQTNKKRRR